MKYFNPARKRAHIWFFVALLTCISFVGGIVMIPLCAVAGLLALMGVGIVFCVHGFYGTVLYWQMFAKSLKYAAFVDAVVGEGALTVKQLSSHFGWSENATVAWIRECIQKRFLIGYRFDGEKLVKVIRTDNGYAVECPYCGAKNIITEKKRVCEYCGASLSLPFEEK